jgi:hypothetical protein
MSLPSVFVQESPLHVCAPIGSIGIETYMQYLIHFVPIFALVLFTSNLPNQNRWVGCRKKRNPSQKLIKLHTGADLAFGNEEDAPPLGGEEDAPPLKDPSGGAAWREKGGHGGVKDEGREKLS